MTGSEDNRRFPSAKLTYLPTYLLVRHQSPIGGRRQGRSHQIVVVILIRRIRIVIIMAVETIIIVVVVVILIVLDIILIISKQYEQK